MALFRYRALTAAGEPITGEMDATNQEAVISWLQESGQIPISTEKVTNASASGSALIGRKKALDQRNVNLITSKLAIMLRAGLPLDTALGMLVDLIEDDNGQQMLERIRAEVQNGATLSDAMQAYPDVFNKLYVNTLRAGEAAGAMDTVLERLADYLERSRELKETVKSALIYPAILTLVAMASLAILLIYVVPQFSELFDGMGQAMPTSTLIVIAISEFIQSWWWLILLSLIVAVMLLKKAYRQPNGREYIDRKLLKIPLFADLIKKIEVARFSRTLGTLTSNGVPLLSALNIVAETVNNSQIAKALTSVSEQLREGKGMAKPLADTAIFPQLAVQLIHVGEESGELEKMLNQLADIYDKEVKEAVSRLLILLEPAMIIGLGLIIATIIISILLAVLSLNELAA